MPFTFNLKEKELKRKTFVGGIVSLIVITVGAIYFGYLCYLYSNNLINPIINETYQTLNYDFKMPIYNNQMAFQLFMSNGQTLDQFQQAAGVTYAIPLVNYISPDLNNNSQLKQTPLNIVKCSDSSLNGFYCFDFTPISNIQNKMDIGFDKNQIGNYRFEISIALCNTQPFISTYNCASSPQIQSDFLKITNKLTMKITTQKYNTQTQIFQQFTKKEQIQIQDTLTNILKINLLKTNSTIHQGFITQNAEYQSYISDYNKENLYFTQSAIQQQNKNNLNLVSIIQFQIGSYELKQNIQYPQFTSILAQFMSAFNVIIILGIIAQFSAQSDILTDFAELQLKSHFKHNAWRYLISKNENKIQEKSFSQNLTQLHFSLKNLSFQQYLEKYLNLSFMKRVKLLLVNKFFDKAVVKNNEEKEFKKLIDQASQQFSVIDLQKELIQMKIILKMLLSPEQYAAIQLCGYRFKPENQNQDCDQAKEIDQQKKRICNANNSKHEAKQFKQNNSTKEQIRQNSMQKELEQVKFVKPPETQLDNKDTQDQRSLIKQDNELASNQQLKEKIIVPGKESNQINSTNNQQNQLQKILFDKQSSGTNSNDNSSQSEDNNLNNKDIENSNQNHLDILEEINNNMNQFQTCIERFFDDKNTKSEIDKRILSCMIGIHNQNN